MPNLGDGRDDLHAIERDGKLDALLAD